MQALRITHFALAGILATGAFPAMNAQATEPNACPSCQGKQLTRSDKHAVQADWNEAHDMETFDSVCCELECPADALDEEDALVIDLDTLGSEPKEWGLGDGMTLRVVRNNSRQLSITFKAPPKASATFKAPPKASATFKAPPKACAETPDDCENAELAELPLLPMPETLESRRDEGVARFQVRYAALMAEGKEIEASNLASQFLADDEPATKLTDLPRKLPEETMDPPRRLPVDLTDSEEPMIEHKVGYKGIVEPTKLVFPSSSPTLWSDVSKRQISFSFHGAKVDDVAQFLRLATGMTVEVAMPSDQVKSLRFQVSCTDEPIKEAILAIARAGGIEIIAKENRMTLQPMTDKR